MTLATGGRANSQENARSSIECPRAAAKSPKRSAIRQFASVKYLFASRSVAVKRAPAGIGALRRYLPVSNPLASGK